MQRVKTLTISRINGREVRIAGAQGMFRAVTTVDLSLRWQSHVTCNAKSIPPASPVDNGWCSYISESLSQDCIHLVRLSALRGCACLGQGLVVYVDPLYLLNFL